jgi:hypothetical protein
VKPPAAASAPATATASTADLVRVLVAARLLAARRDRRRPASPAALAKRLDPKYVITPSIALLSDIAVRAVEQPDHRDIPWSSCRRSSRARGSKRVRCLRPNATAARSRSCSTATRWCAVSRRDVARVERRHWDSDAHIDARRLRALSRFRRGDSASDRARLLPVLRLAVSQAVPG